MAEQQYEEEEYYEDYVPPSTKWLWIVMILAVAAAIVFAVLWHLRGEDVARLAAEVRSVQSGADDAERRLQADLDKARSDLAADQTRATEQEARVLDEQRRAADAARQAESRLQGEIAAQTSRLAEAGSQMEALRADLAAALAAGAKAGAVESELANARKTIAEHESTIGDLKASVNDIGRELASATEDLRRADAERKELAGIRARLTEADAAVKTLRERSANLSRERETLRAAVAALEKTLAAAPAVAGGTADAADDALRRELTEARTQAEALNGRLTEAGGVIARLEEQVSGLEANRDNLANELAAANEQARAAVQAKEALEQAVREAERRAGSGDKALADAVREAGERFGARERELRGAFEAERSEWRRQIEALRQAAPEAPEPGNAEPDAGSGEPEQSGPSAQGAASGAPAHPLPSAQPAEPVRTGESVRVSGLVSTAAASSESVPGADASVSEPRHVIKGNPARFTGRIVQALSDGATYMITGGERQRIKPGMIFDVHRCLAGTAHMHRYIGLLRVTRTMENFSLAIPAYPSQEARVCPVTGRAVLDAGRDTSPYAETEEGRSVPLISAASLGLGLEAPAVGDVVDNPFYDPAKRMVFVVSPDMADDQRLPSLIEGVGGLVSDDVKRADYCVAGRVDAAADVRALHPRPITVDMLSEYVEPPL